MAPSHPLALEAAQRRKIHHVLQKARVRPGHRILEFGSGWGGLAIEVLITTPKMSLIVNAHDYRPLRLLGAQWIPLRYPSSKRR